MQTEQWFPTVIVYDFFKDIDFENYRQMIDEQVKLYPGSNSTGHWSGFNNHFLTNLHLDNCYKSLVSNINALIDQYVSLMSWNAEDQHFKIDRMWANCYDSQENARKHFHSGVLSGCFYLDEGHEIVFHNPLLNNRPEQIHTQVWTTDQNYLNANSISYKSEPGKCLLWPASMMHETKKNSDIVTRSIAFDVWCYSNKNYYFPKIS